MSSASTHDPRLLEGVDLFNRREFFDCHEILEAYWKVQEEPEKQLTQGLIQIAVAYYHSLRNNRAGAVKLLNRGIPRVKPFLPKFGLLKLDDFIFAVEADLAVLNEGRDSSELQIPKIEISS